MNLICNKFANLVIQIELINGAVRELPINAIRKNDIFSQLAGAQFILQQNGALGFTTITELLAILQIIQLAAFKIQNLRLSCPQGVTTVEEERLSPAKAQRRRGAEGRHTAAKLQVLLEAGGWRLDAR